LKMLFSDAATRPHRRKKRPGKRPKEEHAQQGRSHLVRRF
jgi:hypothetical protein